MPTIEIRDSSKLNPSILENGPPYIMSLQLYLWYLKIKDPSLQSYTIPYWFEYLCAEKNTIIKVTNCPLSINYRSYLNYTINELQETILRDLHDGEETTKREDGRFNILALDMHTNVCIGFATAIILPTKTMYLRDLTSASSALTEKGWKIHFSHIGSILMTSLSMMCAASDSSFYLMAADGKTKPFFVQFMPYGLKIKDIYSLQYESHIITPYTLIPPLSYYRNHGLVNYARPDIMSYGYNGHLQTQREDFFLTPQVPEGEIRTLTDRNKALAQAGNSFVKWVNFVKTKKTN